MKTVLRLFVALLFLAAGVGTAAYFIKTKPVPQRKPSQELVTVVETTAVVLSRETIVVHGTGTVVPARTMTVLPEVSGRIVEHHPALVAGGHIAAGETLLKIDDRDFKLAVAQQKAAVARSKLDIDVEKSRQAVAKHEWELLDVSVPTTTQGKDLALRIPQLDAAKVSLASAQAALASAELRVEKATIVAPFNALVTAENVEVGQLVTPQSNLATFVGTDEFWVQAVLPISDLRWLDIPGVNATSGASATVILPIGDGLNHKWRGEILRLLPELDPKGRMARLLISVKNPLELDPDGPILPLFLGAYVHIEIAGKSLSNVVSLPRAAVHDGDKVWVMDKNNRLAIRTITSARQTATTVVIDSGITVEDRVVTSRIAVPIEGMRLREKGVAPPTTTKSSDEVAKPTTNPQPAEGRP
ncbi:MAG: efflux RND transporter periplasmic adaptor subunit [Myxococcales bacterium]|nr:efflux RND transporter periplasmic adaptor subunit [Myxococcales bacterium]